MFGGRVFFRKPRQFNYKPRYYDPEREAREERRREILGDAAYTEEQLKAMKPGQYIRENMRARRRHITRYDKGRRNTRGRSLGILIRLAVLALLFWWLFS